MKDDVEQAFIDTEDYEQMTNVTAEAVINHLSNVRHRDRNFSNDWTLRKTWTETCQECEKQIHNWP